MIKRKNHSGKSLKSLYMFASKKIKQFIVEFGKIIPFLATTKNVTNQVLATTKENRKVDIGEIFLKLTLMYR